MVMVATSASLLFWPSSTVLYLLWGIMLAYLYALSIVWGGAFSQHLIVFAFSLMRILLFGYLIGMAGQFEIFGISVVIAGFLMYNLCLCIEFMIVPTLAKKV